MQHPVRVMMKSLQKLGCVFQRIVNVLGILLCIAIVGCKDLVSGGTIPTDVINPSEFKTAKGAREMAVKARAEFQNAVVDEIIFSGLMTDELSLISGNPYNVIGGVAQGQVAVDRRDISNLLPINVGYIDGVYGNMHRVRGYSINAIDALRKYDSTVNQSLLGELYATQGYAEIFLADLFCDGVPLSSIVFEGDFKYAKGSTTEDMYRHAIAMFDTALSLIQPADSQIYNLALIGKSRSLLAIGHYDEALEPLRTIGPSYQYTFQTRFGSGVNWRVGKFDRLRVSDQEGINGLPYITGNDPRTEVYMAEPDLSTKTIRYLPAKYRNYEAQPVTVVLASGTEAQLIRAEVALIQNRPVEWLGILNDLRVSRGMSELEDAGDRTPRIFMQLNERAAWLFLTGQRQGDLRRAVRNYGIAQDQVYPKGQYQDTYLQYGGHTNSGIPERERANPYFQGCLNRDA